MDNTQLETCGLVWKVETVNVAPGGNNANKTQVCDDAQILTITDHEKFIANFPHGGEILLGIANGTSLRVMSQDVSRRNPKLSVVERQTIVLNRLSGVRNSGSRTVVTKTVEVRVEVKTYALPNGTTYAGTSLIEYQQEYLGALVDLGMTVEMAQGIVAGLKL